MTTTVSLSHARPAVDDEAELLLPADAPEDVVSQRPSGINIGGNTVTQATEHLPEPQRQLVRWLHTHARARRLPWKELAAQVDLSTSVISRIFTDQYRYPRETIERNKAGEIIGRKPHENAGQRIGMDSVCAKIAKYRKRAEASWEIENPEFVETTVFDRVSWLCDRVFKRHKIGFIYGESQIGKTWALNEYARRHNGGQTTYVEMPPASGVQLMTKYIAKALFVSPHTHFERLLDDILDALDPSKLLIIDEIHRVFTTYQKTSVMRCLDTLRHIHDKTKCGLVLCGTDVFRHNLEMGAFKQYLKQLHRRGRSYELQLPTEPPREDLDLLAEKFGLSPARGEAETIMQHIAKADGLGVYSLRLQDGRDLASNKGEKLKWDHFVKAFGITEKAAQLVK